MGRRAGSYGLLIAALAGFAACGDSTGPQLSRRVARVQVTPDTVSLRAGAGTRLSAQPLSGAGMPLLGRPITWESSDSSIATVAPGGLVTTHAPGTVRITATADSVAGEAVVIVDTRSVASVAVEPSSTELLPEQGVQLRAIARDSAGDVIAHRIVSWTSSNTAMVSVSGTGRAVAVGQDGMAMVSATIDGVSASARIGVLPSPCATAQRIAVGQSVSATLSSANCRMSSGRFAARYRLDLDAATSVRIDLRSAAFDAFLYLTDLNGNTIEVDDDGAGGDDARIAGVLAAGSYIIWATSYETGRSGAYTLSVTAEPAQPCSRSEPAYIGRTIDRYLSTLDCRLSTGQYADRYRLDLGSTTTVRIDMLSGAVDAYLMITDLNGNLILRDDDSAGGSDAQLAITLGAGSYIVWATSFHAAERGSYRLAIAYEQPAQCRSVRPVVFGWSVSGFLSSSSCRMSTGEYAERWRLDLTQARTVRITMSSYVFDSYLVVTDLKGRYIADDDDSAGNGDAFLSLFLNPGEYIIWATSYDLYSTGRYELYVR